MNSILDTIQKQLTDIAAKREKQERLVNDLTAPQRELDRLTALEAEAQAAKSAADAELEQLEAELGDAQGWLDRVGPVLPNLDVLIAGAATLEDMLAAGYLAGADLGFDKFEMNRVWRMFRTVRDDLAPARRATVARLNRRIKELKGER